MDEFDYDAFDDSDNKKAPKDKVELQNEKVVDYIFEQVSYGQTEFIVSEFKKEKLEWEGMPFIQMSYVSQVVQENKDQVNWLAFMGKIDEMLADESLKNDLTDGRSRVLDVPILITQGILESLSNSISNGEFDSKYILAHIGPQAFDYIREWDSFMGGKTPGFWDENVVLMHARRMMQMISEKKKI